MTTDMMNLHQPLGQHPFRLLARFSHVSGYELKALRCYLRTNTSTVLNWTPATTAAKVSEIVACVTGGIECSGYPDLNGKLGRDRHGREKIRVALELRPTGWQMFADPKWWEYWRHPRSSKQLPLVKTIA